MKQNNKQEQVQLQKSMEQDQEELKIKQQIQVLDKVKKTMYSRINEFNNEQQELIKQLDDIEELKKQNYKNYLEGFDEEFETHTKVRIKETPLLIGIFNEFVQQVYRPSKMYWLVAKTKEIINQELIKNLNDEQKDLLEQWQYCEDRILDDMIEQAFVYGYATAVELREEAVSQYPYKKEDN